MVTFWLVMVGVFLVVLGSCVFAGLAFETWNLIESRADARELFWVIVGGTVASLLWPFVLVLAPFVFMVFLIKRGWGAPA